MTNPLISTLRELTVAAWTVTVELAPWLLLGSVVAGVLHIALPAGFIKRQFSGVAGVFKAVILGVPLPLCSCGVIPAGLGLRKDGASDGAAVGFLISTPQTGVDSVLVSASFLGWPFALFKLAVAAVTGVAGGLAAQLAARPEPPAVEASTPEAQPASPGRSLAGGVDHALMLLRTIWRWVVFGVVVSAAIQVFVPHEAFAALDGFGSITTGLLALAVSLPLYVCATASVPIAAALVAAGMPAGAAIVFLLAGPATNVATIGAVYRALGLRQLQVYLGAIIVGSLLGGAFFDHWIGDVATRVMTHEHTAAPWAIGGAVVLATLFAWFAFQDLRSWVERLRFNELESLELPVAGMGCRGCASKVESALRAVDGVDAVEVQLEPGRAIVSGRADRTALVAAIQGAGYSCDLA